MGEQVCEWCVGTGRRYEGPAVKGPGKLVLGPPAGGCPECGGSGAVPPPPGPAAAEALEALWTDLGGEG